LQAFVHVSTAYCHCDEPVLEEAMYAAPTHPRNVLQVVDWMDDDALDSVTPK
jgi:fatty acyl-CoA reductase